MVFTLLNGFNLCLLRLFDFMFKDFENNLREMGFGDVAVNKKMKVFISAFYGRISSYSKGIKLFREENDL